MGRMEVEKQVVDAEYMDVTLGAEARTVICVYQHTTAEFR